MSKRVYISSDYSEENGDREVVEVLTQWGKDNKHIVDFIDMAQVVSGSVSQKADCRACDLKQEFNNQINASSAVIFVVGDKTKDRLAGSNCFRNTKTQSECSCTPYKQNAMGSKSCKVYSTITLSADADVGNINSYSYLRHEFEQAKRKKRNIIIVYNSLYSMKSWLPSYMEEYEDIAQPFWIKNIHGQKVGNYSYIKGALGYE